MCNDSNNLGIYMRRLVFLIYLTAVAFVVAHLVNAFIAQALMDPIEPYRPASVAARTRESQRNATHVTEEILGAGLFAMPQSTYGTNRLDAAMPPPRSLDAAKKVKLVGTVVADGREPFAILEELATKKQRLYHLQDEIADLGSLVEIRNNGVMIQRGADQEFLEAAVGTVSPATAPDANASTAGGPVAPSRHTLDRRQVSQSVADLPRLLSQARVVPAYTNGQLDGWRIETIAPTSVLEQIGLRPGDILQRVNGIEIREPGMMLTLLQQVKDENRLSLDVVRNNQKVSLRYDIR
jgi:general secretion pathway protein C